MKKDKIDIQDYILSNVTKKGLLKERSEEAKKKSKERLEKFKEKIKKGD